MNERPTVNVNFTAYSRLPDTVSWWRGDKVWRHRHSGAIRCRIAKVIYRLSGRLSVLADRIDGMPR